MYNAQSNNHITDRALTTNLTEPIRLMSDTMRKCSLDPEKLDLIKSTKPIDFTHFLKEEFRASTDNPNSGLTSQKNKSSARKIMKTPERVKLSKSKNLAMGIQAPSVIPQLVFIKDLNNLRSQTSPTKSTMELKRITDTINQMKKKRRPPSEIDIGWTMSKFRENSKKYRPTVLKPIPKTAEPSPALEYLLDPPSKDDDFSMGTAFLTNINIAEPEKPSSKASQISKPNQSELQEPPSPIAETLSEKNTLSYEDKAAKMKRFHHYNIIQPLTASVSPKSTLPRPVPKSSEENYDKLRKKKPKLYISFKTNSVGDSGKPENRQEHLYRVFNGEGTPFLPQQQQMAASFGPKKDQRKHLYDAYLADYNPMALKITNNNVFGEYYYDD
jgi:hypothetical protein